MKQIALCSPLKAIFKVGMHQSLPGYMCMYHNMYVMIHRRRERSLAAEMHRQEGGMGRKSPVFSFIAAESWITLLSIQFLSPLPTWCFMVWKFAEKESIHGVYSNKELREVMLQPQAFHAPGSRHAYACAHRSQAHSHTPTFPNNKSSNSVHTFQVLLLYLQKASCFLFQFSHSYHKVSSIKQLYLLCGATLWCPTMCSDVLPFSKG